jgi:predicted nucleic acid-binding protein
VLKLPEFLIVDSSTLFALERAGLIELLGRINFEIIIPEAVKDEIEKGNSKKILVGRAGKILNL